MSIVRDVEEDIQVE